jgi:hypothetical protein
MSQLMFANDNPIHNWYRLTSRWTVPELAYMGKLRNMKLGSLQREKQNTPWRLHRIIFLKFHFIPYHLPPESRETGVLSLKYRQISFKDACDENFKFATWEFGADRYILKISILFDNLTFIGILSETINEIVALNNHFEIDVILCV